MAERQVVVLGRDGHYALWPNHVTGSAHEAGATAELVTSRKEENYASIGRVFQFLTSTPKACNY